MTLAIDYEIPRALEKVAVVRRVYPDLYRRETARPKFANWNHLRKMARNRWVRQHPAHPAAITAYVRWGGSIEVAFRRVWTAYGIPQWRQNRLACIVGKEGGFDRMDRWYAGSTGWQGGRFAGSDRVLGPGQIRPYHARHTHPEVQDYYVTERTYAVLTNPHAHARTMYMVGDHAYATLGACS